MYWFLLLYCTPNKCQPDKRLYVLPFALCSRNGNILIYRIETGGGAMGKSISYWQTVGFLFTAVVGTLLHFLFDWTGGNVVAALFSGVNESIWEHLKLLFYPMLAFAVGEYWNWGKQIDGFWCIKLIGVFLGLGLIVVVYYTYTGMLGIKADWLNIALFFLAAGIAYWVETKLFQRGFSCPTGKKLAVLLICLLAVIFTVFTFWTPQIPLFRDPVTGTYGFFEKS